MAVSIEDMKAELKSNDYAIASLVDGIRHEVTVIAPNEWEYTQRTSTRYAMDRLEQEVVKVAYTHLQERKELMALRAFVLEIAADITAPDISDIREDYNSAILKVFALIEQYNITAESEG